MEERHGISILNVDKGHFKDMILEVATRSLSSALLITNHEDPLVGILASAIQVTYFPG